jgi:hypothetical protein
MIIRVTLLVWLLAQTALAGAETPVVQTNGLCHFILWRYALPPAKEQAFDAVVADLLHRHEEVFGFKSSTNFHIRIRLFGRQEDFQQYANTNGVSEFSGASGYYSVQDKEVNLWLPPVKSFLAAITLHECSHAIMDAHYRRQPIWLAEGCAEYFSIPRNMEGAQQTWWLKHRWGLLNQWLKAGTLPRLPAFLNFDNRQFHELDANEAYAVSWSLFQFLMSTPGNREILNQTLDQFQTAESPDRCAEILGDLYPGGLDQFEVDWHEWIRLPFKTPFASSPAP